MYICFKYPKLGTLTLACPSVIYKSSPPMIKKLPYKVANIKKTLIALMNAGSLCIPVLTLYIMKNDQINIIKRSSLEISPPVVYKAPCRLYKHHRKKYIETALPLFLNFNIYNVIPTEHLK